MTALLQYARRQGTGRKIDEVAAESCDDMELRFAALRAVHFYSDNSREWPDIAGATREELLDILGTEIDNGALFAMNAAASTVEDAT